LGQFCCHSPQYQACPVLTIRELQSYSAVSSSTLELSLPIKIGEVERGKKLMLLLLILVLLLLGGGGGYYGYSRWGAGGGVGIFGLVLIILLVYYLVGGAPVRP